MRTRRGRMRLTRLLPLLLLLLSPACASFGNKEPKGQWTELELAAPSDRVLWKVALLSVEKMGFALTGNLDPSSMEIESGWKTNLQPFGRQGYRIRAQVDMDPLAPGRWLVRTRVKRQINKAIVDPLDAQRAEWEWAADNPEASAILMAHIRSFLDPEIELSDDEPSDPLEELLQAQDDPGK